MVDEAIRPSAAAGPADPWRVVAALIANRLAAPAPLYKTSQAGPPARRCTSCSGCRGHAAARRPAGPGPGGLRPGPSRDGARRGRCWPRSRPSAPRRPDFAPGPDHAHRGRRLPGLGTGRQGLELHPPGCTPGAGGAVRDQPHRGAAVYPPPHPGATPPTLTAWARPWTALRPPAAARAVDRGRLRARPRPKNLLRGRPSRAAVRGSPLRRHRLRPTLPRRGRAPPPLHPIRYVSPTANAHLPAGRRARYRGALRDYHATDPKTGQQRTFRVAYIWSSEEARLGGRRAGTRPGQGRNRTHQGEQRARRPALQDPGTGRTPRSPGSWPTPACGRCSP